MSELATVGNDLAKDVFQIHGVDENGQVLVRRQLCRSVYVDQRAELHLAQGAPETGYIGAD